MEYIIIWVLFGAASSMIASSRGRDGCGWFLMGMLFGPFALIFALVSSKNLQVLEKRTLTEKKAKKCPYCAELIKYEAVICRFCGRDLEEIKTQSEAIPERIALEAQQITKIIRDDAADEKIICRSCERQYDGAKRFCPFCGTSTRPSTQPSSDHRETKTHLDFKVSNGAGAAISLSVAALVTIAGIWASRSHEAARNDTVPPQPQQSYASSPKELPIPRSAKGDKGQYYLLDMQNNSGIIKALHKRVGVDSIGFTLTEIDCAANQYRELGYSEISPDVIRENPSAPWAGLVSGSSKSDLVLFVCNLAKTQAGGENQIIQTEDLESPTPVSPAQAKWDECSEKVFKPYFEKGLCGSSGCWDENDENVYPKVLRTCGPDPASKAAATK